MEEFTKYSNPLDYLKVFFRRKWFFLAPAFFGLIGGIASAQLMAPMYESSTVIMIEEERIINPLIQNLAVSTSAAERMTGIRQILLGWNNLVELATKLDLVKDVSSQEEFEDIILNHLRDNITVVMPQDNVVRISYLSRSAKEAQTVVQALTDILIEKNIQSQTKQTDVAINFIKEQLGIYKRKIKESEISSLNEQLKQLLLDSTENHPTVRELKGKIAAAEKELASNEFQIEDKNRTIDENTRVILKNEIDRLVQTEPNLLGGTPFAAETGVDASASLYKMLLLDKIGSARARDISINENIYTMLLSKLETAKITQRLEASKEGTRYTIIDPPLMPLSPIKPNKPMIILIGLMLGCGIGAGLVFGREFMDHSFLDIEDAKKNLDMPILGAISRITTEHEISSEKTTVKIWVILCLFVGFIILAVSFWAGSVMYAGM
jgi:uncharacterized protein involved in exopolysaccharide biosynthesis